MIVIRQSPATANFVGTRDWFSKLTLIVTFTITGTEFGNYNNNLKRILNFDGIAHKTQHMYLCFLKSAIQLK